MDDARIGVAETVRGRCDLTEGRAPETVYIGVIKLRVVQDIEELGAELGFGPFAKEAGGFNQSQVEIDAARATEGIAA